MVIMSPADNLASSSVAHLQTFLPISIVATWSKSAVPAGLLQKKQIGSVDCGSLWAVVDHVRRVGVLVLDCCPEADSALLCWAMFYFVNFKHFLPLSTVSPQGSFYAIAIIQSVQFEFHFHVAKSLKLDEVLC